MSVEFNNMAGHKKPEQKPPRPFAFITGIRTNTCFQHYLVSNHVHQVNDAQKHGEQTAEKKSHNPLHTDICIIHKINPYC